jgi:geranylgeranyl diphosphate synthase, type II
MSIEAIVEAPATAEALFRMTVETLSKRTPSIVAAAAEELGDQVLTLHFGDGGQVSLRRHYNGLETCPPVETPTVECFFDDEWLRRLYDMEFGPAEIIEPGRFDARGPADAILAVWRTFRLLSQRAAGLRVVQSLWAGYRRLRGIDSIPADADWSRSPVGLRPRIPDAAALLRGTVGHNHHSASITTTRVLWDGRGGQGWWELPGTSDTDLADTLQRCSERTAAEIDAQIPAREPRQTLYDLMRDYPRRGGKGLRPTLCMAACGAFGGRAEEAVRISAAIEMFHNAFLIHDDIEDESDSRRGEDCLHVAHGIGLAVNAGDGLNLLAIEAVLSNIENLGLARTLGLIHEIIHMCRETIEGQAMELGWIRHRVVPASDEQYFLMVTKKTGWYTCMSPCRLGAIAAGHTRAPELDALAEVFHKVGVAFQIQDDLLNLLGKEELYGKEPLGDLLEGKRTLMLIHLMRSVGASEREELLRWLSLPRRAKQLAEAEHMLARMHELGSIDHGLRVAADYARHGARLFEERLAFLPESEPKAVLRQVAHYVNSREL